MAKQVMVNKVDGFNAFDALTDVAAKELLRDFTHAATEAHCVEPRETMAWLLTLTGAGRCAANWESTETILTGEGVRNDVFGRRLKAMNRGVFHETTRRVWTMRALDALQEFPPDKDSVALIGDCNEKPYNPMAPREYLIGANGSQRRLQHEAGLRRAPTEDERRFYKVKSVSENTGTAECTKYFFILLTWTHDGHRFTYPLQFRLQYQHEDKWQFHYVWLKQAIRDLAGIDVLAVLLDRWYDVAALRKRFNEDGIGVVVRLQAGKGMNNWRFHNVETGEDRFIIDELHDLANDIEVTPRDEGLLDKEQRRRFVSKGRVIHAILDEGEEPVKLYIRAFMSRLVDDKGSLPELDPSKSIIVCIDINQNLLEYAHLYRVRWRIEVQFRNADEIRGCPRASLINADDLQYVASHALLAWIGIVRLTLLIRHKATHIAHLPLRRITTRVAGRVILAKVARLIDSGD